MNLTWTKEPPTEPGWYWARERLGTGGARERGVYLVAIVGTAPFFRIESAHTKSGWKAEITHYNMGEWAGPIPEPQEADND